MKNQNQPTADSGVSLSLCGARTKHGTHCGNKPEQEKRRCRLHGGAPGSGAPKGNRNALKHGLYTKEMSQLRGRVKTLTKNDRETPSFRELVEIFLDTDHTGQL